MPASCSDLPGARKPERQELPQLADRISFLYIEKARITKEDSALKIQDANGYYLVPAHTFLVLLLGPGTSITHRAAQLLADAGTCLVWSGEGATQFYGYGRSLAKKSNLLERQAKVVSDIRLRLAAVRKMYQKRFDDECLEGLSIQQLRGKEGARMRQVYKAHAQRWRVEWTGREYDPRNFQAGSPVNRGLSIANTCLYGIVYSIICGLGMTPGLGVIHCGLEQSLVYDIADLYKAEITIPLAFQMASQSPDTIDQDIRREMRTVIYKTRLIERIVSDIQDIFSLEEGEEDFDSELSLWNGRQGVVAAGQQYAPEEN